MNRSRALSVLVGLGLGVALVSVLLPANAARSSASPWLQATRLGPGYDPVVAASAGGDVVAAWASVDDGGVVRASFRPAGGRWQPVVEWPGGWGVGPRVAIDRRGDAIAVWIAFRENSAIVEASFRPAGKRWAAPVVVSAMPGWASSARVGMDGVGNVVVAWRSSSWPDAIQTRYRSADTGTWAPVAGVSSYAYSELELAMAPGGRALLAWDVSKDVPHVVVAAIGEKGHWGQPTELGGIQESADWTAWPKALAPAIGETTAIVAWQYEVHGNGIVQSAVRTADGRWESAVDLSFTDGQAFSPAVSVDGAGNTLAAWDANIDVEGSVRTAGAESWQRPVVVSPSRGAPALATNARGDAMALWRARDSSPDGVQAARRPAASARWEATADVASGGGRFDTTGVAIDGAGDAVAVWERNDGQWWVEVAASDVAPPVVTKLVAPRTARTRKPVRFSVKARDTWSRVTEPVWTFGDGSRVHGSAVIHRYRAPGRFRVTVTVADALGHATATTRAIVVRRYRA